RNEFARNAVEDIKEPVLRRLRDHLARTAVDVEIEQHELLYAIEIPVVVRNCLVVPLQLSRRQINRQDRACVEIVEILCAPEFLYPRLGVACADINQIGFGIVRKTIPRGAAAALGVEIAAPGLRSRAHRLALERLRRIARHRVETPCYLARL